MGIVKAFKFPASVHWRGGRLTRASAPGKPELDVATPPEFKGGIPGLWSPEELLIAATASCFAVTLAAVADRSGVEMRTIDVDGVGHVERGDDGRFAFTVIELAVEVEAEEHPHTVERVVADAERLCIVTLALEVPVHVRLVAAEPFGVAISG
jgi:organic hydroperoxide reductase OsmC/OhrA